MDIFSRFYTGWVLYNFIAITLLFFVLSGCRIKKEQYNIFLFSYIMLFLIVAIYGNCITPDYEEYREIIETIATTKDPFVHVENFYKWWIPYIGNNHTLYLFILYSISYSFIYFFLRKIQSPNIILLLFTYVVILLYDSIAGRQFLFYAVYTTGILLLVRRYWFSSFIIIIVSMFLHKIAYIAIPLLLIYFIPLNRRIVIILFGLFPILVIVGNYLIHNYLLNIVLELNWLHGSSYLIKEAREGGSFWWNLIALYQIAAKYLLAFYVLYCMRDIRFSSKKEDRIMYSILFWCVFISLIIYSFNLPDTTIPRRCLSIGIIPLCYLISLLPQYVDIRSTHKICFLLICLLYLMFNNAYIVGVSHSILR